MPIKVLVVDDSAFMRKIIKDILSEDPEIEVIDTAKNGKEAIEKLEKITPDVMTLDVEMPIMDGIETLKYLNDNNYNIPILMVSSITTEGAELTLKALEIGAVDFITKPTSIFKLDSDIKKSEIIEKLKISSRAKVSKLKINTNILGSFKKQIIKENKNFNNIIAIGTSTGGPKALQEIIPNLLPNIDSSIFIVQHMPPGFTKSLANRLDSMSQLNVKEAEHNEIANRGYCYIAPGDKHMTVEQTNNNELIIKLLDKDPVSGHKPSVDVLFESISKLSNYNKIAVILTGMGSDGANGMKLISDKNGYTIAQNEESCIVFGMPKSAIKNGSIKNVLPLNLIADDLLKKLGV